MNNHDNLNASEPIERPSSNSRNVIFFGLILVFVIFFGIGLWAATAPLAKAVSAYANLSVKGERKQIQHLEGGIVGSLHVTEGQHVARGELLLALNPLQASATVARHEAQLDQALVRKARLESELIWERIITLSGQLLDRLEKNEAILEIFSAEEKHLHRRLDTIEGTITILNQRIEQLDSEIQGLKIQQTARIEQLKIFEDEIVGLKDLNEKGYYPKSKILAVERAMADLRGAAGNDLALIARAKSARGEAENQIVSVKQRFREDITKQLRDTQLEITDLNERLRVAEDVLERIEVRAPRSGIVQGIKFHTVGGVIKPGDILMEIAPQDEELVVKARVLTEDIDSIEVGQRAEIRLTALNTRATPAIYGFVKSVSGDSMTDPGGKIPYFLSIIEIPTDERKKLGKVKLSAGMTADVLIQTGERTALNYILKPMLDAFARGLNEE